LWRRIVAIDNTILCRAAQLKAVTGRRIGEKEGSTG